MRLTQAIGTETERSIYETVDKAHTFLDTHCHALTPDVIAAEMAEVRTIIITLAETVPEENGHAEIPGTQPWPQEVAIQAILALHTACVRLIRQNIKKQASMN